MKKIHPGMCWLLVTSILFAASFEQSYGDSIATERILPLTEITDKPASFRSEIGESGRFTWWLPPGAEEYVLPLCGGVLLHSNRTDLKWIREQSPHSLAELPLIGVRYGEQWLVIILPWPHYAELIFTDRVGIRFNLPQGRHEAAPCVIVAMRRAGGALEIAKAFRQWRLTADDIGVIPRPRPIKQKIAELDTVSRLLGAAHFYLWGPALFSRHDVSKEKWAPFAKALLSAPAESFGGQLLNSLSPDQHSTLRELAKAEFAMDYLTAGVAGALESALTRRHLLDLGPEVSTTQVIARNKQALVGSFAAFLNPPESWGDGPSKTMLNLLHEAGVSQALLLLSDLYGNTLRSDVVAHAEELGYLIGPYDSYHSIHSPTAKPDDTWETAQFDAVGYQHGRVLNADGSPHAGFKGRGYHFSPKAAWPYVQQRVNRIASESPYSAWFVDCDATAESFEDYAPEHPATMLEDTLLRRQRLAWLESKHRMVVGSEGGSVLFADVIHFGHGPQTPYIGHLDRSFRDPTSRYFAGRAWPPDSPESSFKPTLIPPAMKAPFLRSFQSNSVVPRYAWRRDHCHPSLEL